MTEAEVNPTQRAKMALAQADEWNKEAELLKASGCPKSVERALAIERCADRCREGYGLPHRIPELARWREAHKGVAKIQS